MAKVWLYADEVFTTFARYDNRTNQINAGQG